MLLMVIQSEQELPSDMVDEFKLAQAKHHAESTSQRVGMRNAIITWAKKYQGDDGSPVSNLEELEVDINETVAFIDDPLKERVRSSPTNGGPIVLLIASDFGGNLPMPMYGLNRPSKDYYSSNLTLYAFVITGLSTGMIFEYSE